MSNFEDGVWNHLVREHAADKVEFNVSRSAPRDMLRMTRRRIVALSTSLGTAVAAIVLVFTVFTSSTPAYAFAANDNGTVTLSLNDIATGIPAVNQLLAEHGIHTTVVPIEAGCTATAMEPQESAGAMSETVTVGNQWIPAGYHGFLAAMQMPNGDILLAMGTTADPIPSCFPATPAPRPTPLGSSSASAGNSGAATPAGSTGTATP